MVFIVPFLMVAVGGVLLSPCAGRRLLPRQTKWLLGMAATLFILQAGLCGVYDAYEPFAALKPFAGTRSVYFMESHGDERAATLVDLWAGSRDVIAVDAGPLTWLYPLWGEHFTRQVQILDTRKAKAVRADARWVVIDRSLGSEGWDDPKVKNMSEMLERLTLGSPRADELVLFEEMRNDPSFQLVYFKRSRNQAIFLKRCERRSKLEVRRRRIPRNCG